MNYGKILVDKKNNIKKIIKSKKELIQKLENKTRTIIFNDIVETRNYSIENIDNVLQEIKKNKECIKSMEYQINLFEKDYMKILEIIYSDESIDKLTDNISNFAYEIDAYEFKNNCKDNFECKEQTTDLLFTDTQKVIDFLLSYDNLSQEDISKRDILINNIIFIFNVNK